MPETPETDPSPYYFCPNRLSPWEAGALATQRSDWEREALEKDRESDA